MMGMSAQDRVKESRPLFNGFGENSEYVSYIMYGIYGPDETWSDQVDKLYDAGAKIAHAEIDDI